MQSQPKGKKTSLTLPFCHPCAPRFVAMLACSGGEKLTLQTKFLSKYMEGICFFCWHGGESHRKLWKE